MNNQREKGVSPQPLEIYCGPSSTYLPYMVSSPNERPASTQFSPNYTMVESGPENGVMKVLPQPSISGKCFFPQDVPFSLISHPFFSTGHSAVKAYTMLSLVPLSSMSNLIHYCPGPSSSK
ncbi:hypothetical protein COOONC_16855 [Cooperia oncophora]